MIKRNKIVTGIVLGLSLQVSFQPLFADSLFQVAIQKQKEAKSLGGGFVVKDLYKVPKNKFKVHDLITVMVKETIKSSNKKKSETSKESSLSAKVNKHFTLDTAFTENSDLYGAKADIRGAGGLPEIDLQGSKGFSGDVTINDDTNFEATITCEIIQVLPNENLVLEARRVIKNNKEVQTILFTGTIRSKDVTSDNKILSSRVFGANIEYKGKGPMSNTAKKGLLSRLVDLVLPI